jgi:hypothetical protein
MNMQTRIKKRSVDFAPGGKDNDATKVVLSDGAVALVWPVDGALGTGLRCRVLSPDHKTERTDFLLEAAAIDFAKKPRLTALPDGGFRIAWVERGAAGPRIESEEIHPTAR